MSPLRLRLLGPPEVTTNGRSVRLGHKTVAILALLALRGRTTRRDLARMLWPEASDPLNSLSAARSALIRSFGPNALRSDTESIALADGVTCDAVEFRRAAERGDAHAWELWRGEFLMGLRLPEWDVGLGEEFEAWLYETREALRACRRDLATAIAAGHLRAGAWGEALPYLELTLEDDGDPREDAARWLILTYGALGQPDRSARVFASLVRNLRAELDLQAAPGTHAALDAARAGQQASRDVLACEFSVTSGPP